MVDKVQEAVTGIDGRLAMQYALCILCAEEVETLILYQMLISCVNFVNTELQHCFMNHSIFNPYRSLSELIIPNLRKRMCGKTSSMSFFLQSKVTKLMVEKPKTASSVHS